MPAETKIKDYPVVDCTLIGKRVREARKSSHMTQEELAEKCSCISILTECCAKMAFSIF